MSATTVEKDGRVGRIQPFDLSGVYRGEDGVLHYAGLHPSLVAMLRETAERVPEREAIVELGGPTVTYRELWDRSSRVAGGLAAAGVQRGDRVAIRLGNGVDWCLAFFGGLMAGAIVVPVNTRFAEPEIAYVLEDSGAAHVFMPGDPLPDGDPVVVEGLEPDDVAAIFYTSGTTGQPKGAMTTHENFLANVETVLRSSLRGLDETARMLISVPLFHVTGCNSQLLPQCRLGGTTVVMPAFNVRGMLDAIVEQRTDALVATPAIFWLALNQPDFAGRDVAHVRWAVYGGAPMPPEQVLRMKEAFPNARLANGYGMTETASVATTLPHEHCEERPESVGFAAPNAELRLEDVGFGGGAGELLIRSSQVVPGYWRKEDETERALDGGWLHTGDIATIDDDGFVAIVDRIKDLINRGGENVYSIEVENALALHPSVAEVAVVGVPDEMMGEKVGAVVVAREGTHVDRDELLDFAAGLLADFKLPQYLVITPDSLPRNAGGKVVKHAIRSGTDWGDELPRRRKRAAPAAPAGIAPETVGPWLAANVAGSTPPYRYTLLAGGRSNLTFEVADGGGRRFVLRRPPLGQVLESAHDMSREHRIIAALAPTPVPVPTPLGATEDPAVNGAPFYVMELVDGIVLRSAADAEGRLDEAARTRLAEGMIDVLADLGAVDPDAVGLGDLGRRDDYVGRQLRRWHRQFEQSRTRELPAIDEVHRRLGARVPPQQRTAIVHGDYRIENCMVGEDGSVRAVLDWELCTLGDPLADLGWLMAYWTEPGEPPLELEGGALTALPGFPTRAEAAARYAARTGADVSGLDFYVALALWKLACITEGVYARYKGGVMGDDDGSAERFGDRVAALADQALALTERLAPLPGGDDR